MKGVEVEVDQRRHLTAVLGPMSRGAGDPSLRRMPDGSMWLVGTSDGEPFSAHIVASTHAVRGVYWGPGREVAATNFPDLLGAADDPAGFTPAHEVIASQWRTYGEVLRTPRSLLTWQTALAAVLEQRVTGVEARGAWRALVTEHGTPAPGPVPEGMRVPPTAAAVSAGPLVGLASLWRRPTAGADHSPPGLGSPCPAPCRGAATRTGTRNADGDFGDRAVDRRGDQRARIR